VETPLYGVHISEASFYITDEEEKSLHARFHAERLTTFEELNQGAKSCQKACM
jgi:hypothetical protein